MDYKKRIEMRLSTQTHDLGFLYSLSCIAAYKLTGNEMAKDVALLAADALMERYLEKAGIIQAWGDYYYFEALMRLDRNWKIYW